MRSIEAKLEKIFIDQNKWDQIVEEYGELK